MGGANYLFKVNLVDGNGKEGIYDVGEYDWPLGESPRRPVPYSTAGKNLTYGEMLKKIHDERSHLGDLVLEHCRQPGETVEVHYERFFAI